jgi:hypothetical protein
LPADPDHFLNTLLTSYLQDKAAKITIPAHVKKVITIFVTKIILLCIFKK